jgi:hypothetical protein
VCTENSVLIDYVTESPNIGGDATALPPQTEIHTSAQHFAFGHKRSNLAGLGAPMQVATSELQSSGYLDGATRSRRTADKRKAPPLYDAISRAAPAICSFEFQSADEFKYEVTKSGTPMRA